MSVTVHLSHSESCGRTFLNSYPRQTLSVDLFCWSEVKRDIYRLGVNLLCGLSLIQGLSLAGGPDNQVHFEGYQVSNQCMALVRDECLLPCKDAPELGYAKESSSEQYVPDVFYKVKTPRC